MHITGRCGEQVCEDRDVTMVIGEGEECGIVPGVEAALGKCKKGEKARSVTDECAENIVSCLRSDCRVSSPRDV